MKILISYVVAGAPLIPWVTASNTTRTGLRDGWAYQGCFTCVHPSSALKRTNLTLHSDVNTQATVPRTLRYDYFQRSSMSSRWCTAYCSAKDPAYRYAGTIYNRCCTYGG